MKLILDIILLPVRVALFTAKLIIGICIGIFTLAGTIIGLAATIIGSIVLSLLIIRFGSTCGPDIIDGAQNIADNVRHIATDTYTYVTHSIAAISKNSKDAAMSNDSKKINHLAKAFSNLTIDELKEVLAEIEHIIDKHTTEEVLHEGSMDEMVSNEGDLIAEA